MCELIEKIESVDGLVGALLEAAETTGDADGFLATSLRLIKRECEECLTLASELA